MLPITFPRVVVSLLATVSAVRLVRSIPTYLRALARARLFYRACRGAPTQGQEEGAAAVHGAIRITTPLRHDQLGKVLWYRCDHQVYAVTRFAIDREWQTERSDVAMADLAVETSQGNVELQCLPEDVEPRSAKSKIRYPDRKRGWIFSYNGGRREILQWLPVPTHATVLGRMERRVESLALVKDKSLGFAISPRTPGRLAAIEFVKGAGGLLGMFLGAASLIAWFLHAWATEVFHWRFEGFQFEWW